MRHLSVKQRKILTEWYNANKDKVGLFFNIEVNDFPYELYARLVSINDYETIVQDINRFLSDLSTKE